MPKARLSGPRMEVNMSRRPSTSTSVPTLIDLGPNPVNDFQAREYARESSPSTLAVVLELTENARDNATEVRLTIEVEKSHPEHSTYILTPKRIICEDNGVGLTHNEFLTKFCGAYAESASHHEVDRAGRNGVGTKTYTSIADKVVVKTTTGRPTEGLDIHRDSIMKNLPKGTTLPKDGEPDTLWRAYIFRLHTRHALSEEWTPANAQEMGTNVELADILPGTEISLSSLIERLSYAREWLENPAHSLTLVLTRNTPVEFRRPINIRPWTHTVKNWLVKAIGRSDQPLTLFDDEEDKTIQIPPAQNLPGVLEFDLRVVGKGPYGTMHPLEKPALLLEVCGAVPYPPNLDGVLSARTLPILTFVGLEHASSIGAFCNTISGWARISALPLKEALRNNKTTLASGPGSESVEALRRYLHSVLKPLHMIWYEATRAGQDAASKDAIREAQAEVNLAIKGVNPNPFRDGDIVRIPARHRKELPPPPIRRHRWECGACEKRWLVVAEFTPTRCAENASESGIRDGCGSQNIGLAKNQPRIGDCEIRIEQLGDRRITAVFQFDQLREDLHVPVVRVNLTGPRYIELRGIGSMSGQAQKRLKQFLVDSSLVAIADYYAKTRSSDFSEELGSLYFNRMLRCTGIKQYEAALAKVLESDNEMSEQMILTE